MATQDIEFDTNPIDYSTANLSTVHTENYLYYYYNHPKYEGIIYVIGDGVTTLGNLRKHTTIGQFVKTASISSGTYILAETTTDVGASGSAIFIVKADSESYILHVSVTDSASAKNIGNTTVKILSSGGSASALSFDLAKSDSVGGAGFRLRVTSTASYDIEYQIVGGDSYWSLVAATVTDNDKTPSGDTATFLVAEKEIGTGSFVSGYNVIAKLDAIAGNNGSARFRVIDSGGGYEVEASIKMSASAKTHANTTVEILDFWGTPVIDYFVLAKSDSVDASGAWLIANSTGSSSVTITMTENIGNNVGWELVAPYSDPDPVTLPDGVTAATYLISGNTYSVVSASFATIGTPGLKISATEIAWAIPWGLTPLPGATTLTHSGTLSASGAGITAGVTGFTLQSIDYKQNLVNLIATIDNPSIPSLTALVVTSAGNAVFTLG